MPDEIKDEVLTQVDETQATDGSKNTEEASGESVDKKIPYDRFKAKVDEANALKEKLAAYEKAQADKEREELERQNEYKTLYEQAVEQAEKAKQEALAVRKSALLTQAGYTAEQTALLSKLVDGQTDGEIVESIKLLKAIIPAQDTYGDPSAFNGPREKPEPTGADELGAKVFERIKNKIF